MNEKIKRMLFVLTLITLFATVGTVCAADDANVTAAIDSSASDVTVSDTTDTISDTGAAASVTTISNNEVDTKTIEKEEKNLKTQSNHILQSESDFDNLFTSPNSNNIYELTNSVSDGDDITFDTDISKTGKTYIINKEVNIIGNDKTITLNTLSGSYFGNETGSSFIFDNGAAHSTVTNLNFYNTQVIIRNTTDIVFDNIDQTVSNQNIGQGIGAFSIRANSSYITVENSRFSTTNNGGSSTLVLASASHCTLNNNIITATGNVGNLLYLTTYNIEGVSLNDIELNSYNTLSNNILTGTPNIPAICYGIALTGHDNNILYNTVNIAGQGITTQWAYIDPATPQIGDNSERYKGNTYTGNVLTNGASFKATNNSTITGNTLNGVTLVENCTFIGNTATSVSVTGKNNYLCNNTITTLTVGASATNTRVCECNAITNHLSSDNIVEVFCEDCEYCGEDTDTSVLTSNKVLKQDDDNIVICNITEENFSDYFLITVLDDQIFASFKVDKIATYIIYLGYIPSNITQIGFPQNANTRKSNVTLIGVNNLTINDKTFALPTQFNKIIIGNFTYNYEFREESSALYIYPSNSYVKEGFLIENITINSNKNLEVDSEIVPSESERHINPVKIRTYTNKDNAIPVIVNNVTINMKTDSYFIDWDNTNKPYTIPIAMESINANNSDVTITNCNINFNETGLYDDSNEYSTIWGVYLLKNAKFTNNTININGRQCVYGVVARGSNIIIENNTINSHSTGYYADGINVESQNIRDVYIANNILNITAGYGINSNNNPHVAYGALILDYSYKGYKYVPNEYSIENISYINNTIICDAGQSYGVEIFGGINLNISDNKIYLTSRVPMGIGAIGENVTISGNNVVTNGTNNATESTVDYLTSRTVGVYTRYTSVGINITNNTINSTSGRAIFIDHSNNTVTQNNTINVANYTNTVEINVGTGNNVTGNYLVSPQLKGNESVYDYQGTNNLIKDNIPVTEPPKEHILKVDTTEFTAGTNTTLQATIYYENKYSSEKAEINKGKVTFKVNGKTLKDENGKIIYAKIVNGTATIENYEVPSDWAKEGTTIQAVYSGSTECDRLTSEKTNITVTQEELTLTTTATQAAPGQTTTLTATLSDTTINTGKIVFKINGKTVKDANGKVIYAKVVNGTVSVDYTLPETYKTGNYTVTATFIASGYDRLVADTTMPVEN